MSIIDLHIVAIVALVQFPDIVFLYKILSLSNLSFFVVVDYQ